MKYWVYSLIELALGLKYIKIFSNLFSLTSFDVSISWQIFIVFCNCYLKHIPYQCWLLKISQKYILPVVIGHLCTLKNTRNRIMSKLGFEPRTSLWCENVQSTTPCCSEIRSFIDFRGCCSSQICFICGNFFQPEQ